MNVFESGGDSGSGSGLGPTRWWRLAKWKAYLAIAAALVTIVMSTSMVFVMLSAIADDYGITLRAVGWVVITESLVISALLLPLGGLADTIGRRRMYLTGLGIFAIGAVATGLSPTFAILIIARMVMSIGNAMVQSVGTGMLAAAFPPNEKGLAMGAQTTAVSVGAASGPLIAGFALQLVGWNLLFLFMAVPAGLAIIAGRLLLADDGPDPVRSDSAPGFDRVGSLLSAGVVVILVFTISNPFALPWLSPFIIGGLVAMVVVLALFIGWELRHPRPVLQLRVFKLATFRIAVLVRFFGFVGATSANLLLPIYLVSLRGLADGVAGVILFCVAAGMAVGAQVSGRLSDRAGPRAPSLVGLGLQAATAVAFAASGQDTPIALLAPLALVVGVGMSLWNVPNNGAMMASVPARNFAVVGAFTNVTRTMGSVVGQALAAAIVVVVMAGQGFDIPLSEIADTVGADAAFLDGWRTAFVVSAILAAVTGLLAARLPSEPVTAPDRDRL